MIAALSAAQPLLTRVVIDQGLIGRQFPRLVAACLGMLVLAVIGFALGGLHRAIYIRASGRTLFSLRGAVYAHLLRVSPRRLARVPVGDLVSRLDGDIAEVQRFGTDAAASFVSSVLTLAAVGAVMLGLSWRLTPADRGAAAAAAAGAPLRAPAHRGQHARVARSLRPLERISGGDPVGRARGAGGGGRRGRGSAAGPRLGDAYLGQVLRQQLVAYATGSFAGLLGHLATAATFVLGGWYVLHGQLSVGTLVAFIAYLGRSSGSAASIASLYTGYQRARVSLERVEELLDLPVVAESPQAIAVPADARGALRFEAVSVARRRRGRRCSMRSASIFPPAARWCCAARPAPASRRWRTCCAVFWSPTRGAFCSTAGRSAITDWRICAGGSWWWSIRRCCSADPFSTICATGIRKSTRPAVLAAARQARVDEFVGDLPRRICDAGGRGRLRDCPPASGSASRLRARRWRAR